MLKLSRPAFFPNSLSFVHSVEDMPVNMNSTLLIQLQQTDVVFARMLFVQLTFGHDFAIHGTKCSDIPGGKVARVVVTMPEKRLVQDSCGEDSGSLPW